MPFLALRRHYGLQLAAWRNRGQRGTVWDDASPIREEMFGPERLEQHARSLATAQPIASRPRAVPALHARLESNAGVLLTAYRATAADAEAGRPVVPAAEWLLDNYHLVEEQIREIRDDLPVGYYRQLPKLADGPFAGYPRVLGLAWAYVAHTDSHFDPEMLRRFIAAYQQVQPLTIGELWAVAITLRIVLIENLRRLADQITDGRRSRRDADLLADRLLASGEARAALDADILIRSPEPLNEVFAAQLVKRLRDQDPLITPALGWIEARLNAQGASVDDAVQHAQQRLGASNVTVRNVITSMRLISDIDWAELFESVSLVDARLRTGSDFDAMDFPTRNLYRSAIEQLARGAPVPELAIADLVLEATAAELPEGTDDTRPVPSRDPGYHLIGEGRGAFERTIRFRPPARLRLSRLSIRLGIGGYIGTILGVTLALMALALWALGATGLSVGGLTAFALLGFLPANEVATALVNRGVAWMFGATILPGLELAGGVPVSLRTLIAVPTLLTSEADLLEQVEGLEIHFLSGSGGDLTFALLSDGMDADAEVMPDDARLLERGVAAIDELNRRHGPGPAGDRFLLLHRHRRFNPGEGKWMGWERKRGKLHELNRLLRGADDTSFMPLAGRAPWVPADVRYVITLDVDTRLPRDAALRLVGKMAHPLNRPNFDAAAQRVVGGYGILQPRVTPSLPIGREGSFYQRVISGGGGMDPYAAAVSDVYQDLFGEGSYTGKGIYDIDAFEAALAGRIPDNTLLSHDLFEGVFARAGLASDIEVVEEFPSRYEVVAKRQHRWMRGDWQLLPWMLGAGARQNGVTPVGRGKMLDNLRRSTLGPLTLLALCLSGLLPLPAALVGALLVLATIAVPAFLPIVFAILPRRPDIRLRSHLAQVLADLRLATAQSALSLVFLPDQAWRAGDAALRTLLRLGVTHRHLLAWTSAATSSTAPRLDALGFYRQMAGSTALALGLVAAVLTLTPASWPLMLPLGLLWLLAPAIAHAVSRSPKAPPRLHLDAAEGRELRLIARRTWRFFETFVTPAENMLPPDNFQEVPRPVVAHRTSPTNIGLYLLSAVAARDFGWAGTLETIERLEATFATLKRMSRFRGHFFNWYGTQDLAPLPPDYVSSVDSGNLAGHLIALANACEEWTGREAIAARAGLADCLALAREALATLSGLDSARGQALAATLDEIDAQLNSVLALDAITPVLKRLVDKAARSAADLLPAAGDDASPDITYWIETLGRTVNAHERDRLIMAAAPAATQQRLGVLAETARAMAMEMDFAFLLDPERKLLSIGYSLTDNGLDPSCYDLLASEARLASLFAIAKGDAPTRHWFRLGRLSTPVGNGSALISWSGSMFEYLMPSLVMRAPAGSVLEQTSRLVVERQQSYARTLGVPWGMSESAYNARDIEFTYQYGNFGVPGLGLKRGLSENTVIAPYATGLAAMVYPESARQNFARLAALGALGRYGFYEALDFTRARVPEHQDAAIVRSFMAHHQGMTIVAIANTLMQGEMRARFHREPMIRASELLLQERSPRDVVVARPRAEEVRAAALDARADGVTVRHLSAPTRGAPVTHLLSNGSYAVMMTANGGGYSRWRDIAVTRWREDSTRDDGGSFIFLRDRRSGSVWSATPHPMAGDAGESDVVFGEDHAEFIRRDPGLTTALEVIVSGEHNGEVRRVCLTNSGRRAREIELTSYAELVLTTTAADMAHPAFAKMFVVTEHLPEFGALIATRRLRAPGESQIWAAHFAVVEGELAADPQYETARAHFIGRGRHMGMAEAMRDGQPLSNTVGTVLDPVFSLRQSVRIAPGKMARVAFWTLVASSREELLDLIDTHHDRNAFERARTLAWTQAQVQLRHIAVELEEAADFQRLAAPILYADRRFRPASDVILRGAGPQSGLWQHAISGDLPIVLLRIDDIDDIAQVRQLLRAREYWRMKRLAVDLVIINERASSYVQDLQIAIEAAVRTSASRPLLGEEPAMGTVKVLRADLMSMESRALLHSVARVVLLARRGTLASQLARIDRRGPQTATPRLLARAVPAPSSPAPAPALPELEFFNGLGGFDKNGREYVIVLGPERTTPAPWINVVANAGFGFQVSAEGSGYSWAQNSRENQLTPWSNDAVVDPAGEAIYVRDEVSGELWSPTAQPIRDGGTYVARHGFGYSRFEHEANGIGLDLLQFVPLDDPIKISRLVLTNRSGRPRRLSVTTYAEWVLGTARGASAPFLTTERDEDTGALLARNPWSSSFGSCVAFADLGGRQSAWTADRTEFLGRNGALDAPHALTGRAPLSGATGAGLDPCAALQSVVELGIGESVELVALLGQSASVVEARALIARYRRADLDAVLAAVTAHWDTVLGTVQVKTPDRAMDIMLNGWLLYQTLACRITARSAFYQASGAYGFRDQLQDGMALTLALPAETRGHILRAAGRQFVEGDVQHWWLPQSGQGVRTRISDDVVWLAYATATYIENTGDAAILDESVPYLDGPQLAPGEHDQFFQPMPADETGPLFEHCARGLDLAMARTGALGLPLMGTGDWNDGMNRVGEGGRGESVWLGWLLIRTIEMFAPLAEARDPERARQWRAHAASVRRAIERSAWDGAWYRRATFDDGTWLGAKDSEECRIDSIAQSWAVLSGAADSLRASTAMASLERHLLRPDDKLALLFTPPFDRTPHDPGYIKGYPPGLRENGGQYSHAAMWAVLAFARLGDGDRAHALFARLNPINHARTPDEAERYKTEPYVVAADVYSVAPHDGRGGWSWYTGSAGWMHRAGVEGILGIRPQGDILFVEPTLPASWPGFEATVTLGATVCRIEVCTLGAEDETEPRWQLDETAPATPGEPAHIPLDGHPHTLRLCLRRR
ncbi:glucoamylase family protein [Ancylobacter sp. WKF20]|uniref:GH36-type glycosyl hydrolase domain-containing protein n=1 Tax=Ancylobacter sp. WKF20 TaxID=3039801 RepID=UPI0024340DD2|nr:glucoamylase family protein [Ancylobacter sp. WKF20]WGD29118.1 glucoamylase family protein [Ancylobacter sp. WKF20]